MCFCLVFVWCVSVFESFWMFGGAFAHISFARISVGTSPSQGGLHGGSWPGPRGGEGRAMGGLFFWWAREQLDNWGIDVVIAMLFASWTSFHAIERRHPRHVWPWNWTTRPNKQHAQRARPARVSWSGAVCPPLVSLAAPAVVPAAPGPALLGHWLRPGAPWRGGTAGPPVAPGQAPRELAEGFAACLAG